MKFVGLAIIVFMCIMVFVAIRDTSDNTGKNPKDERISFSQERNQVTGELLNLAIIRCCKCGEVLEYTRYHLNGKLDIRYQYEHRCNEGHRIPYAKWRGLGFARALNLLDWLEKWQRRLKLKL